MDLEERGYRWNEVHQMHVQQLANIGVVALTKDGDFSKRPLGIDSRPEDVFDSFDCHSTS